MLQSEQGACQRRGEEVKAKIGRREHDSQEELEVSQARANGRREMSNSWKMEDFGRSCEALEAILTESQRVKYCFFKY